MKDLALQAEAIRLHTEENLGYKFIGIKLALSPQTVGNWIRKWRDDQANPQTEPFDAEFQELSLRVTFRGKRVTKEKLHAFWEVYNRGHPKQGDQWDDLMPALCGHVAKALAYDGRHPTKSKGEFSKHLLLTIERLRV